MIVLSYYYFTVVVLKRNGGFVLKIGLIGCGSIGEFLLEQLNKNKQFLNYEISAVFDARKKSTSKLEKLSQIYQFEVFGDLKAFLNSNIDIVVECANIQVANKYATQIIQQKDLVLISIGALAEQSLYEELQSVSKLSGTKVYLPAGAIGGLELIKAANIMKGLYAVSLISRKPLAALSDESLVEETVLFEGSAKDAIEKFPANANVAITLSLAGLGIEKTQVKIIADPAVMKNNHTIQVQGDFGEATFTIENNPSPTNSKTSYLTALSILSTLQSLDEQITIG